MLRKYSILPGVIIATTLLVVAARYYPGGSQFYKNSIGYNWKNNYLSNLFGEKAVNGSDNASRLWALCGMFFLCISFALFFIEFSKKIPLKGAAKIIKYCGGSAMAFAFLAVTPLHDTVITVSGTLALLSMFYITVFVFMSRLHFFKILCIVCLLTFYCCNYFYYTRSYLELLPIMQKVLLVVTMIWVLGLEYFTKREDFKHIKIARSNGGEETTKR